MWMPARLHAGVRGHAACTKRGVAQLGDNMEKHLLIATLVCLALVACEPRGTPQKPQTIEQASVLPVLPGTR